MWPISLENRFKIRPARKTKTIHIFPIFLKSSDLNMFLTEFIIIVVVVVGIVVVVVVVVDILKQSKTYTDNKVI